MQNKNNHAIIRSTAPAGHKPLIGPSGRLYGYIDPTNLVVEFKTGRGGRHTNAAGETEVVDLKPLLNSDAKADIEGHGR